MTTAAQVQKAQEDEIYNQALCFSIASTVILASDYLASLPPSTTKSYNRPRVPLSSENRTPTRSERISNLLQAAKDRLLNDQGVEGVLESSSTYHQYYLSLRIFELDILLSQQQDDSNAEKVSASIKLLWDILRSSAGLEYAKKNIDNELYRRELVLWLSSLSSFEVATGHSPESALSALHAEMLEALKAGDTNWDTILTAVHAAWGEAKIANHANDDWWETKEEGNALVATKSALSSLGDSPEGQFSSKDRGYTLGLLYLASYGVQQAVSVRPATDLASE